QPAVQQNQQEATTLELGRPIERELGAGQKHTYGITLTEGQFFRIEIREISLEVGVVLHWPNGDALNPWTPYGAPFAIKPVSEVAKENGTYKIDVYAGANSAGKYEIRITELRAATAQDRAVQEARELYTKSRQLAAQGKWADSIPLLLRCLAIREQVLG